MKRIIGAVLLLFVLAAPPASAQNNALLRRLMDAWYEYQVMPVLRPVCSNEALVYHKVIYELTMQALQGGPLDAARLQEAGVEIQKYASPQCVSAFNAVKPVPPSPGPYGGSCMGRVCCTSSGCTR